MTCPDWTKGVKFLEMRTGSREEHEITATDEFGKFTNRSGSFDVRKLEGQPNFLLQTNKATGTNSRIRVDRSGMYTTTQGVNYRKA